MYAYICEHVYNILYIYVCMYYVVHSVHQLLYDQFATTYPNIYIVDVIDCRLNLSIATGYCEREQ